MPHIISRVGPGAHGAPRAAAAQRDRRRVAGRAGRRRSCGRSPTRCCSRWRRTSRRSRMDRVEEVFHDASSTRSGPRSTSPAACSRCATRRDAEQLYLATLNALAQVIGRGQGGVPRDRQPPRGDAGGPLLLQLLAVPVAAGPLGDRPALPDHADPPAERAADPPRHAAGRHLRFRRRDRPLRRRPEGQAVSSSCTRSARTSPTSSASSSPAPTRRSSATCTTCSATRTRCTCG